MAGIVLDLPARLSDYELRELLSDDVLSARYLAAPPARLGLGDALVVVKVLPGGEGHDYDRFVADLETFAAVGSPHLVAVYDAGRQGDVFFLSLERPPLGTLAEPASPLDRAAIVQAVADAARGAHALHEAGLAHRDIRPATIGLGPDGARLADLGLAGRLDNGSVSTLGSLGSVEFVDPAVIRGDAPSRASDVYSLGATLHRALTGRALHPGVEGADPAAAVRLVLSAEPTLDPSLDPPAAAVITRLVSADASERPATAAEAAGLVEGLRS